MKSKGNSPRYKCSKSEIDTLKLENYTDNSSFANKKQQGYVMDIAHREKINIHLQNHIHK